VVDNAQAFFRSIDHVHPESLDGGFLGGANWSPLSFAQAAPDRDGPKAAGFAPTPRFAGDTGSGRRNMKSE
jgi:hypothetical protein